MTFRERLASYGPYVQPPNAPLFIWAVSNLIKIVSPESDAGKVAGAIALVSLTVWAVLEVWKGAGPFRRILGTIVLAAIAFEVLMITGVI